MKKRDKSAGTSALRDSAAAKRRAGRGRASASTTFQCDVRPDAREVFLVGDFNNWDPRSDRMVKRGGKFQKSKRLAPGEYQYKFVVDGEWHTDPDAPQVPNEYGTQNSVIRVTDESRERG